MLYKEMVYKLWYCCLLNDGKRTNLHFHLYMSEKTDYEILRGLVKGDSD